MSISSFWVEIQRRLPVHFARRVVASLRQDALVWSELERENCFERLSIHLDQSLIVWSPGALALKILDFPMAVNVLSDPGYIPLEKPWRERCLRAYELTLRTLTPPTSLGEAGLLALALRERRRLTRSWTGLAQELSKNLTGEAIPVSVWKTALACLYAYISDPLEMLGSLLVEWKGSDGYALISHALLSNPMTYEEQIRIFRNLLERLSEGQQLEWLRHLRLKNQTGLVRDLAGALLLSTRQEAKEYENPSQDELLPEITIHRLSQERRFYYLYRLSGQPALAITALQKMQTVLQSWHHGIQVALASCAMMSGDEETRRNSLSVISNAVDSLKGMQPELAFLFDGDNNTSPLLSDFSGEGISPILKLKRAEQLAKNKDVLIATQLAKEAAQELREYLKNAEHLTEEVFAFDWSLDSIVKSLMGLELHLEALETAQAILEHRPDDVKLIDLIAQILENLEDFEGAQQYLTLAIALEPDNPFWYRRRARLSEQQKNWQQAMQDYRTVLELVTHPEADDYLAFARSSAACNQHGFAAEACRRVLERYPDHDEASCQLGISLLAVGQPDAAIPYLAHSTTVAPKNVKAWLALVESLQKTNQPQRALEALRSSVIANPDSLELCYVLGVTCLQRGLLSEGLPFLQKADANGMFSPKASLYYARVLCALERYDEAREVLDRAMSVWPQDVELNYCLGELLVKLGRNEEAITVLETATLPQDTPCDWLVLYARAMLGKENILFSNRSLDFYLLTNAQRTLQRIIALNPDSLETRLWLAEVLAYQENYQDAFEVFSRLAEISETPTPDWRWRVQGGLGLCALNLGYFDLAIAALREAVKNHSSNGALLCLLARAYLSANLVREALQTAREALNLAPNDLDVLGWFADFAKLVEAEEEALNALKCATQLAPQDPAYWIRLAELQYQIGDHQSARDSLSTLLGLETANKETLKTAADLYLKMNDPKASLACIEQALSKRDDFDPVLGFEKAYLLTLLGDFATALEELAHVEEVLPNDPTVLTFEADLMIGLQRLRAAQACLSRALSCFDDPEWSKHCVAREAFGGDDDWGVLWLQTLADKVMIHVRLAGLERRMGNLSRALAQIQVALEENEDILYLRFLAADLCASLLQFDKATQYATAANENTAHSNPMLALVDPQDRSTIALQCLRAELSFFRDEEVNVAYWLQEIHPKALEHPWVVLIQSRLLARQGNWKEAQKLFWHASSLEKGEEVRVQDSPFFNLLSGYGISQKGYSINPAWRVEAALDTFNWRDALHLGLELLEEEPSEPLCQLAAIKAIVICTERQLLCEELNCTVNAPGLTALSQEVVNKVEKILSQLHEVGASLEVDRWVARARLVLQPTIQSIREMMNLPRELQSEETLCLVFRRLKNPSAVSQVLQQPSQKPAVLLQLALCYLGVDDEKAFDYARRSVEMMPSDPLSHIVLAKAAEKNEVSLAYESIKNALAIWSDEPEWHVMAARYARLLGRDSECMDHWEQAYVIKPEKFEYVFGLGEECLRQRIDIKAIELLSKACNLKPESGDAWLALAEAYQQGEIWSKALECAMKAEKLMPDSTEPLLVCSEAARALGNMGAAEEHIRKALAITAQDTRVVLSYVNLLTAQGHYREALSLLESYLPGLGDNVHARLKLAELLWEVKGIEVAFSYVKKLVEWAPEDPKVLTLYAKLLHKNGDQDNAVIAASKALRLLPQQSELHLLLGRIYQQRGQLDQALHHLSEAVRQSPGDVEAYLELGKVYRERREHINALYAYQQAISLFPSDVRAYIEAASVLRETKDYAGAEAMLRKASQLAPDDLNVHRQLSAIIALNLIHRAQEVNIS